MLKNKVCFPFVGDTLGGSHLSAIALIRALRVAGVDVVVVVHEEGPLVNELLRMHLSFCRISIPESIRHFPRTPVGVIHTLISLIKVGTFCWRKRIKFIHTNDARTHLMWGLAAMLFRRKHIWHQRTVFHESRSLRFLLTRSTKLICISKFVKASFPDKLGDAAVVIANPLGEIAIDKEACFSARKKLREMAGHSGEILIFGTFGNLTAIKDPLTPVTALAAFSRLSRVPAVLVYFGKDREGYKSEILRVASANGINDRVLFVEFQRPVAPWIEACDLIFAPSICDAFGRTLIEAMAVGVPVVATDSGGHREIICHGSDGYLVKPGAPDLLANAAYSILNNRELRDKIILNGKKKTKEKFDGRLVADRVKALYQ
jgi:glycosyltransferase involved in cell wall biosynthesis